jgi:hypothetical protein
MRRLVGLGVIAATAVWLAVTAGPTFGQSPSGTVTATVQVQAAACITINPTSFAYSPAGLSSTATMVTTTASGTKPVVTNCSTAVENFLVKGGDATGNGGVTWELANTFDCGVPQTNKFKHEIKPATGSFFIMTDTPNTWETSVAANGTRTVDTRLTMPCTGSNGVGITMSTPIIITATVQ